MSHFSEAPDDSRERKARSFETTNWKLVLAAGQKSVDGREAALAELCGKYWYPLYSFVRRRGASHEDAQDLTQGFFEHLLSHDVVGEANPERGRFRTFLLQGLKNYMNGKHRKANTIKRGGKLAFVSLDDAEMRERFLLEPSHSETPERLFDRNWANELIDYSVLKLEGEQTQAGKAAVFEFLKDFVAGDDEVADGDFVDNPFGMSPGALSQVLFRLRGRFRGILREQVKVTVSSVEEIDDEVRALLSAL